MIKQAGRINRMYGGRHYKCIIDSNHYFMNAYKYVYFNPVKAGVCDRAEDYPYSTLNGLLGGSRLVIPTEEDLTLFSDPIGTLDWINRKPSEDNWTAVRNALRRTKFKFAKPNRNEHPLETSFL